MAAANSQLNAFRTDIATTLVGLGTQMGLPPGRKNVILSPAAIAILTRIFQRKVGNIQMNQCLKDQKAYNVLSSVYGGMNQPYEKESIRVKCTSDADCVKFTLLLNRLGVLTNAIEKNPIFKPKNDEGGSVYSDQIVEMWQDLLLVAGDDLKKTWLRDMETATRKGLREEGQHIDSTVTAKIIVAANLGGTLPDDVAQHNNDGFAQNNDQTINRNHFDAFLNAQWLNSVCSDQEIILLKLYIMANLQQKESLKTAYLARVAAVEGINILNLLSNIGMAQKTIPGHFWTKSKFTMSVCLAYLFVMEQTECTLRSEEMACFPVGSFSVRQTMQNFTTATNKFISRIQLIEVEEDWAKEAFKFRAMAMRFLGPRMYTLCSSDITPDLYKIAGGYVNGWDFIIHTRELVWSGKETVPKGPVPDFKDMGPIFDELTLNERDTIFELNAAMHACNDLMPLDTGDRESSEDGDLSGSDHSDESNHGETRSGRGAYSGDFSRGGHTHGRGGRGNHNSPMHSDVRSRKHPKSSGSARESGESESGSIELAAGSSAQLTGYSDPLLIKVQRDPKYVELEKTFKDAKDKLIRETKDRMEEKERMLDDQGASHNAGVLFQDSPPPPALEDDQMGDYINKITKPTAEPD
jgi:hypothetical protein